jgi:regulator of sigma E protease
MELLLTIFFFILIISFLVFVHEFGHFATAKLLKTDVKQFAIGFGNNIVSKKYKGTIYSIKMIPMGGFVELEGERQNEGPNSFRNKPFWAKFIILIAGVTMNFIAAIFLFWGFLALNDYKFIFPKFSDYDFHNTSYQEDYFPITVGSVDPNGNSAGQLFEDDNIVAVNDRKFSNYDEFIMIVKNNEEKNVTFSFLDFDTFEVSKREVRIVKEDSNGHILNVGLIYDDTLDKPSYFLSYNKGIKSGVSMAYDLMIYQVDIFRVILGDAFKTKDFSTAANSVGGLPQVVDQVNEVVDLEAYYILLVFAGMISLSLILFNVLPIPALDGGQIAVYFYETITRRRLSDKTLQNINTIGFVFLMSLAAVITLKDVIQLNWIGKTGDFVKSILGR